MQFFMVCQLKTIQEKELYTTQNCKRSGQGQF